MEDKKLDEEIIIAEIRRYLDEFNANFDARTSDPNNFATFSELEGMLGKMINETQDLYLKKFQAKLSEINEKELIRKKKENTPPEE